MWLIPIWTLSLIPVLDRFANTRTLHVLAGLFLAIGCFSTFWPIKNPWTPPWMFSLLDRHGYVNQYKDPVPPLERKHDVWFSSLPETYDPESPASITLICGNQFGAENSLALSDRGRIDNRQRVSLTQTINASIPSSILLEIDHVKFNAGEPIEDWLIEPNANELTAQRDAVLTVLRGLPITDNYRAGRIRFVRSPLRNDAFTKANLLPFLDVFADVAPGNYFW